MKTLIVKLMLILFLLFGLTALSLAQTTLSAGDIAIIGLNSDGDDDFSFLLLKDITAGTSIYVTDKGWNDGTGFYTIAGDGIWQWSTVAALSAGTVVHIKTSNNGTIETGSLVASPGTVTWVENNSTTISYTGDQIFLYQGTAANPVFITGCTWDVESSSTSANWSGSCAATQTSALPDQLTNGVNAIWLYGTGPTEYDNFRYKCSVLTSGTPSALRAAINNISNWDVDVTGTTAYTLNPYPCTFSIITPPTVITNSASSITATTATGNGNITVLGSPTPSQYGVVWGTSSNPTVDLSTRTSHGTPSGTGAFTSSITGLTAGTTYHLRAYATNSAGTSYGDDVSFTTLTNGSFTGITSTDWNTASNWAGGSVPTLATDVTIPSGKTVVIAPTTTASCKNLTAETEGNLTIQSSNLGTGSLIISESSSGSVSCQRYMTNGKWHLISPSASEQTVAAFLTANTNIPTSGSTRGMMDYNTLGNSWNSYYPTSSASGTMDAGKGYSARIATTDGTITFTGALTTGAKTVALTTTGEGWNCVGNPYTSAINMNTIAHAANNFITVNSSNLDPSYACVYVWDEDATYTGQSCYKVISNSDYSTSKTILAQNYVAPGQGFFVKANTSATTISFTSAMQSQQANTTYRAPTLDTAKTLATTTSWPGITLTATSTATASSAIVTFNENMTNGLDPTYDAGLLRGTNGLSLYTRLLEDNGVDFAIQCLPENYSNLIVPVGVDCKGGGEITFSAETTGLPENNSIVLEDRTANAFNSLADGATYQATVAAGSTAIGRFYMHIDNIKTGTAEFAAGVNSLKAFIANETIIIEGEVSGQATATLYNSRGQKVRVKSLQKGSLNTLSCPDLSKGLYLLTIQENGATVTCKLVNE